MEDAIAGADAVVFALWLDTIKELTARYGRLLERKVVVDPSNPLGFDDKGQMIRTLPDDRSSGFDYRRTATRERALREGLRHADRGLAGE